MHRFLKHNVVRLTPQVGVDTLASVDWMSRFLDAVFFAGCAKGLKELEILLARVVAVGVLFCTRMQIN